MKSTITKSKIKEEEIQINGQDYLRVTLENEDFDLPFKVIGSNKVAFLDLSGQVKLVEKAADLLVEELLVSPLKFDTILNPVAKSNALAHAIAIRLLKAGKLGFEKTVVARKAKPDEHHSVEVEYRSVTTPISQTLYLTDEDAEFIKGKKVLLVDDVYGQGGTSKALKELVEKAGGKTVAQIMAAAEKRENLPEDLLFLFDLPSYPVSK